MYIKIIYNKIQNDVNDDIKKNSLIKYSNCQI
jgi:hypothetical protein